VSTLSSRHGQDPLADPVALHLAGAGRDGYDLGGGRMMRIGEAGFCGGVDHLADGRPVVGVGQLGPDGDQADRVDPGEAATAPMAVSPPEAPIRAMDSGGKRRSPLSGGRFYCLFWRARIGQRRVSPVKAGEAL
jgi:hypothetical protein